MQTFLLCAFFLDSKRLSRIKKEHDVSLRSQGALVPLLSLYRNFLSVQVFPVGVRPSTVNVMLKEIHCSWLIQKLNSFFIHCSPPKFN